MTEQIAYESTKLDVGNKKEVFPPSFKEQLIQLKSNSKSLIYVNKDEELKNLEYEFNKLRSKRSFLKKMVTPLTIIGIIVVFIIISWAIFASWIAPFTFPESTAVHVDRSSYAPPTEDFILGTTEFGNDVFSRLIWGARNSLILSAISVSIGVIGGVFLGLIAAYSGGVIDSIIMRLTDIVLAFPGLILAMVLVAIFGRHIEYIIAVYGILGIPGYARLMRGAALGEINKTYVHSAKVSGASNLRIIFKHILPNCIAPIIISVTFDIGGVILSLAGLAFLGFGDESVIEWGYDIALSKSKIYVALWAPFWPGFAILITVLGFMLLGDGLRDALDPRLKH